MLKSLKNDCKQIYALFIKTSILQIRQWKTNLIQIFFPIAILLLMFIYQILMDTVMVPLFERFLPEEYFPKTSELTVSPIPMNFFTVHDLLLYEVNNTFPLPNTFFFTEKRNNSNDDENENENVLFFQGPIININNGKFQFIEKNSSMEIDDLIYSQLNELSQNVINQPSVIGSYEFIEEGGGGMEYVVQYEKYLKSKMEVESITEMKFSAANMEAAGLTSGTIYCVMVGKKTQSNECENFFRSSMVNIVNQQYVYNKTEHYIDTKFAHFPYQGESFKFYMDIIGIGSNMFLPMVLIFLLPSFLFIFVNDKQSKSRELMSISGLKFYNYVFVNFVMMFITFAVSMTFYYLIGRYIFKIRLFTQTDPLLIFIGFFSTGICLVSFSFMISAFFGKTVSSTIIAYIFIFVGPMLISFIIRLLYDENSWLWKFFLILFPYPMVEVFYHLGIACDNLNCLQIDALVTNVHLLLSIIFCLIDSVICVILGLYFDAVLPQPFGVPKHPLFFISFLWKKCKKGKSYEPKIPFNEDEKVAEFRKGIKDGTMKPEDFGVLVNGLVKKYDGAKINAVDGIHLAMKKNQLFGLLGENGAGKTTAINCIVGMHSINGGECYINGLNTSTDMKTIRKSLGVVPQFDVLLSDLTPREIMMFYLLLKDYPIAKASKHVDEIIEAIGLKKLLEDRRKRKFKKGSCLYYLIKFFEFFFPSEKIENLSGGMKRLVQIGIALCGNPKVILMDEPTTGLDVPTKRKIWDLINEEKKNRTIILTTHSMEEGIYIFCLINSSLSIADTLSDVIAIMAHGKVRCVGDQLYLKGKYGVGYTLKLRTSKEDETKEFIANLIPESKLKKSFGKTFVFQIKNYLLNEIKFSKIFKEIEENKERLAIQDYECFQSTLDDVFLNAIAKQDKFKDETVVDVVDDSEEKPSVGKEIIVDEIEKNESNTEDEKENELKEIKLNTVEKYESCYKLLSYFKEIFFQVLYLSTKNVILIFRNWKMLIFLIVSPFFVVLLLYLMFLLGQYQSADSDILHPPVFSENEFHQCKPWNTVKECYLFVYTTNNNTFAEDVMDDIIATNNIEESDFKWFPSDEAMLGWIMNNTNTTTTAISFSNETTYLSYQNYTGYVIYYNSSTISQLKGDSLLNIVQFQMLIDNTILYFASGATTREDSINVKFKAFPKVSVSSGGDGGEYDMYSQSGPMNLALIPIFVLAVSSYFLIYEKEHRLREYLKGIGVINSAYWLSWGLIFVVFNFISALVTILSGYMFVIPIFLKTNFFILFFQYFLFNNSMNMLSFFLSVFVSTKKGLIGIVLFLLLFVMMTCAFMDQSILYSFFKDKSDWMTVLSAYIIMIIYSPMNFAKIYADEFSKTKPIFNYLTKEYAQNVGFKWKDLFVSNQLVGFENADDAPPTYISFLFLILNTIIYFYLSLYFDKVVNDKAPLWFFLKSSYWFPVEGKREINEDLEKKTDEEIEKLDSDLKDEYKAIRDKENKSEYNFRILNLSKTFKKFFFFKQVQAVKKLDVGVKKGELVSLLGHNGAGKTTTINCVKGTIPIGKGDIMIGGHSSKKNLGNIRERLGVCPQFSDLWGLLTPLEHLQLCGRIKKIPRKQLGKIIDVLLKEVRLFDVKKKKVSTFSVAMSIVGKSDIILLDEPTTGLDPFCRRQVWDLIWNYKKNTSIILTTHSMEEAEFLSDKIAIMVNGKMCCFGNSLHLKNKYKSGYSLTVSVKENMNEKFESEIMDILPPETELVKHHAMNYVYHINQDKILELSDALKKIEEIFSDKDGYIENFGVSSTTLESVYVKVNEIEKKKNEKKKEEVELVIEEKSSEDDDKKVEETVTEPEVEEESKVEEEIVEQTKVEEIVEPEVEEVVEKVEEIVEPEVEEVVEKTEEKVEKKETED